MASPRANPGSRRLLWYAFDAVLAIGLGGAFVLAVPTWTHTRPPAEAPALPLPGQIPTPFPSPVGTPDPVAAREYTHRGEQALDAQKLTTARYWFVQAAKADPSCESCFARLYRTERELLQQIDAAMTAGLSDIDTARYDDAIREFEKVKLLDPDPKGANFQNAEKFQEIAERRKQEL